MTLVVVRRALKTALASETYLKRFGLREMMLHPFISLILIEPILLS